MVTLLSPDSTTATVMCGRYIDRLERRDGVWRIAVRRATVELAFTADARLLQSRYFIAQGYEHGTRDRGDCSYERPLTAGPRRDRPRLRPLRRRDRRRPVPDLQAPA